MYQERYAVERPRGDHNGKVDWLCVKHICRYVCRWIYRSDYVDTMGENDFIMLEMSELAGELSNGGSNLDKNGKKKKKRSKSELKLINNNTKKKLMN